MGEPTSVPQTVSGLGDGFLLPNVDILMLFPLGPLFLPLASEGSDKAPLPHLASVRAFLGSAVSLFWSFRPLVISRKPPKADNSENTIIAAETVNVMTRIVMRLWLLSCPVQSLALMLKMDAKKESGDLCVS